MMRGAFSNIRIRNPIGPCQRRRCHYLLADRWRDEYLWCIEKYREESVGLIILAGDDYGMGSSRDWAAKGVKLLRISGHREAMKESTVRILSWWAYCTIPSGSRCRKPRAGRIGKNYDWFTNDRCVSASMPKFLWRLIKSDGQEIRIHDYCPFDSEVDMTYYRNGGHPADGNP